MDRTALWDCFPEIPHAGEVPTALSLENYEDLGWQEPLLYKPTSIWESCCDEDSSCSTFNELPTSDSYAYECFEAKDFFGLFGTEEYPPSIPPQQLSSTNSSIRKSHSGDATQAEPKRRKQSFNEKFDEEAMHEEYVHSTQVCEAYGSIRFRSGDMCFCVLRTV